MSASTSNAGSPSQQRAALRLVSTQGMDRAEWLAVRKQGLGGSDAAAAVGLNPYQSALELWMMKTGRDGLLPSPNPDDIHSPLYWGTLLEPKVAEAYAKVSGNKVRRVNAVLQHPDADKAWMLANLDYSVVGNSEVQILECKTAGRNGARLWDDGVPEYIQCQVQHQLAVTGKRAADVAVLICGQELQIHRIERDEAVIDRLIHLERAFWQRVLNDIPPKADGSDSADQALRTLYPQDNGETLDLRWDTDLNDHFQELLELRDRLTELSNREALLKQNIQQRMGESTQARFTDGKVSWKRSKDGIGLDTAALLKDQPKLLQQYAKLRPGSRRFVINAKSNRASQAQ